MGSFKEVKGEETSYEVASERWVGIWKQLGTGGLVANGHCAQESSLCRFRLLLTMSTRMTTDKNSCEPFRSTSDSFVEAPRTLFGWHLPLSPPPPFLTWGESHREMATILEEGLTVWPHGYCWRKTELLWWEEPHSQYVSKSPTMSLAGTAQGHKEARVSVLVIWLISVLKVFFSGQG